MCWHTLESRPHLPRQLVLTVANAARIHECGVCALLGLVMLRSRKSRRHAQVIHCQLVPRPCKRENCTFMQVDMKRKDSQSIAVGWPLLAYCPWPLRCEGLSNQRGTPTQTRTCTVRTRHSTRQKQCRTRAHCLCRRQLTSQALRVEVTYDSKRLVALTRGWQARTARMVGISLLATAQCSGVKPLMVLASMYLRTRAASKPWLAAPLAPPRLDLRANFSYPHLRIALALTSGSGCWD